MQYKTIVLELLRQRPELHTRLRRKHGLLATVSRHARQLKTRHEELKTNLARSRPELDPSQAASAALEMALRELESRLLTVYRPAEAVRPASIGTSSLSRTSPGSGRGASRRSSTSRRPRQRRKTKTAE